MGNITIQISKEELTEVLQAYHTFQNFIKKMVSPSDLYKADYLNGLREAQEDVKAGRIEQVKSFEDFVT
ncbi:MAG: hypothetical protein IIB44_00630 [Candidatus Marinimicrobia bacterium]|nr:hypothetical protein [Candidatus Neomarinimicrobiota bacterium]MCH8069937.1 hypothetical protein [Candidatus Neomarinimicrobiota bacterium]